MHAIRISVLLEDIVGDYQRVNLLVFAEMATTGKPVKTVINN